jgi:ABC-type arginine transport system permease subunit
MMGETKEALVSTLIHTLELAACVVASVVVLKVLGADGETSAMVMTLVLAALTKFVRSHEDIPVGDYVNNRK